MTLSPTSNVTVPPVRKLGMAGRNRAGNPLSIAHLRCEFNAKVLKTGLFLQFRRSTPLRTSPQPFPFLDAGGDRDPRISTRATLSKWLNLIHFRANPAGVDCCRESGLVPHGDPYSSDVSDRRAGLPGGSILPRSRGLQHEGVEHGVHRLAHESILDGACLVDRDL